MTLDRLRMDGGAITKVNRTKKEVVGGSRPHRPPPAHCHAGRRLPKASTETAGSLGSACRRGRPKRQLSTPQSSPPVTPIPPPRWAALWPVLHMGPGVPRGCPQVPPEVIRFIGFLTFFLSNSSPPLGSPPHKLLTLQLMSQDELSGDRPETSGFNKGAWLWTGQVGGDI